MADKCGQTSHQASHLIFWASELFCSVLSRFFLPFLPGAMVEETGYVGYGPLVAAAILVHKERRIQSVEELLN